MAKRRMAVLTGLTLAAAGGLAACNRPATPSAELSQELDAAASAPSLALAPTSGSRDVISAVEQAPNARRAVAPSRTQPVMQRFASARQTAPVATQQAVPTPVASAQASAPTPVAVIAQAPAAQASVVPEASPSPRPVPMQQAHRGPYKTEAEVFRNAPFPITP